MLHTMPAGHPVFDKLAQYPTDVYDLPRGELIAALTWNDPNGCYNDGAMLAEFDRIATADELRVALLCQVIDSIPRG